MFFFVFFPKLVEISFCWQGSLWKHQPCFREHKSFSGVELGHVLHKCLLGCLPWEYSVFTNPYLLILSHTVQTHTMPHQNNIYLSNKYIYIYASIYLYVYKVTCKCLLCPSSPSQTLCQTIQILSLTSELVICLPFSYAFPLSLILVLWISLPCWYSRLTQHSVIVDCICHKYSNRHTPCSFTFFLLTGTAMWQRSTITFCHICRKKNKVYTAPKWVTPHFTLL